MIMKTAELYSLKTDTQDKKTSFNDGSTIIQLQTPDFIANYLTVLVPLNCKFLAVLLEDSGMVLSLFAQKLIKIRNCFQRA